MAQINLVLDKRFANKQGTCVMKISLSHKSRTVYHSLALRLKPEQWDERRGAVKGHPQKTFLNTRLGETLLAWRTALFEAEASAVRVRAMTANELLEYLRDKIGPDGRTKGEFKAALDGFLKGKENKRTRALYEATWNRMKAYDDKAERLAFADINRAWLEGFFAWMAGTSPSVNARNIHLRNIRAVFNWAMDNEMTQTYPFRRFKIRPEATRKRNLKPETLRAMLEAKVRPHEQKYLDAFRLSFLLIGMNMADLLSLTPDCLVDGRIEYRRMKTHRLYSVRVEPEAQEIIDKYRGTRLLLNWAERCKDYRSFYIKINPVLKKVMPGITTYWARHSWATIAASMDIPKETIAHALGHGEHSVTDVYIEFDNKKVDEANRRVIDRVFGGETAARL